jgi:hypothetical protein
MDLAEDSAAASKVEHRQRDKERQKEGLFSLSGNVRHSDMQTDREWSDLSD